MTFDDQPNEEAAQMDVQRVSSPEGRRLEDLTLAELFGQIWRAPGVTLRALSQVITPSTNPAVEPVQLPGLQSLASPAIRPVSPVTAEQQIVLRRAALQLSFRIVAFLLALYGSLIFWNERTEQFGLNAGLPYLLIGFLVWLVAEVVTPPHLLPAGEEGLPDGASPLPPIWREGRGVELNDIIDLRESSRLKWLGATILFGILAASANAGNRFTLFGVFAWFMSILCVVAVFAPPGWGWSAIQTGLRAFRLPRGWTLVALLAIMIAAAIFRLNDLSNTPPEMTSDHVEKILDARNVLNGITQVFFPNNGGRDPIQFYLMAGLSQVPGLGLNFSTLKLLTVLEGLISIPLLWWMGREMIGEQEPELGNLVGLLLAALVATSAWHVMLSRLGLRIILTVIFTSLLIIYLSRALRHNRRGDFIKAGLVLGFGLYAYQSIRMLPIVVLLGVGLTILFRWIGHLRRRRLSEGDSASSPSALHYFSNLLVLTVVAFVIFLPMLAFAVQYPEDFWRRTSGRLLGDDLVITRNAEGELVERIATWDERLEAFQNNIGKLLFNIRNALLMYNWKGDVAWITNVPNRPEMDQFAGSLLIVGLAAWLVRMVRRRDPADWLMIPMVFIMLLPSALSIAYPIENPSATRTSGTLPVVYLFAALPLALVVLSLWRLLGGWQGKVAGAVTVGVILLFSFSENWTSYFREYRDTYLRSSPAAYTEAGRFLRGFAESGGSYGNAYMIAYPYWWDHRALGIEAGRADWPNGIIAREDLPKFLFIASQKDPAYPYRLDPEKDLLFFYSPQDVETESRLREWFPEGYVQLNTSYKPGADYMTYRVPKLGFQGLVDFFVRTKVVETQ